MVKTSVQSIYTNGKIYLSEFSKFLYEVQLYKIYKDRIECSGNEFRISDKYISTKNVYIKKEDYTLAKIITWLGAPLDYLQTNNYKLCDESNRIKRSRQQRRRNNSKGKRGKK